jgi:hypothetical protein
MPDNKINSTTTISSKPAGLDWQPWKSVSEGSTTPGAVIAAVPWEDSFALFITNPQGAVYTIKATQGYGWQLVPGLTSKPGAPITALASGGRFVLFMADAKGEVFTTSGIPYEVWPPSWTSVSQGSTTPGAPIAAVPWEDSFALFLSDPGGGFTGSRPRRAMLGTGAGTQHQAWRSGYRDKRTENTRCHPLVYDRC